MSNGTSGNAWTRPTYSPTPTASDCGWTESRTGVTEGPSLEWNESTAHVSRSRRNLVMYPATGYHY